MQNKEITLVKFGGSVITDKAKESCAKIPVITQLSRELFEGTTKANTQIILAHGAGSFGHPQAAKFKTAEGYLSEESLMGFALVRQAVTTLNSIVVDELIKAGLPAVTFSPMSFLTSRKRVPNSLFLDPLEIILKHSLTPVIHGDGILDDIHGWTIFSGETILNNIAIELLKRGYRLRMMVEVGSSAGVYDSNLKTIPRINESNFKEIEKFLSGSEHTDVTGGMLHKVKEALFLAKSKVPTYLISPKPGNLLAAINGQKVEGTIIS